jgi:predicted Zn-dependent protease
VNTPLRVLLVLPLIAGLAWAGVATLDIARSDSIVGKATREMDTWTAAGIQPAEETWGWVYEELKSSSKVAPGNPATYELMGLLESRRTDRQEYLDAAVVDLTKALEMRPISPHTWANLAEAKYRLGDTGGDFQVALQRAAALGPAEPGVQRVVANLGLAVWNETGSETRVAVDRMVGAGTRRNAPEMLQIAERRGRLEIACRHLVGSPRQTDSKWLNLCKSTEATS